MKHTTRKMLLNLATGIAVATAAAFAFLPATQAAPGVVTANVNVRSGPGTNYAAVDTIVRGAQVDVQRCEGSFCYIQSRGVSGWVSGQYLTAGGRQVNAGNPGLSFGFTVGGNGGSNVTIGIGNGNNNNNNPGRPGRPGFGPGPDFGPGPGARPPVRPRPVAEVCFFDRSGFRGQSDCYRSGDSVRDFGRRGGSFQSMENNSGLRVELCQDRNFRDCRTYTTSANSLGRAGNNISSIRVR